LGHVSDNLFAEHKLQVDIQRSDRCETTLSVRNQWERTRCELRRLEVVEVRADACVWPVRNSRLPRLIQAESQSSGATSWPVVCRCSAGLRNAHQPDNNVVVRRQSWERMSVLRCAHGKYVRLW